MAPITSAPTVTFRYPLSKEERAPLYRDIVASRIQNWRTLMSVWPKTRHTDLEAIQQQAEQEVESLDVRLDMDPACRLHAELESLIYGLSADLLDELRGLGEPEGPEGPPPYGEPQVRLLGLCCALRDTLLGIDEVAGAEPDTGAVFAQFDRQIRAWINRYGPVPEGLSPESQVWADVVWGWPSA